MEKMNPDRINNFRKKAEEIIKNGNGDNFASSHKDPEKLFYELKVHQIELELQNEELRIERDRAEKATEKYSDLYSEIFDFTPVAFFSLSSEGKILELNLKASELLGYERSRLINKNLNSFLTKETKSVFDECLAYLFNNKGKTGCEIQILRPDGPVIYAWIEGTRSRKGDKCLAMAIDITERKYMEEALKQNEESFSRAQEMAMMGNWQLDLRNNELIWSDQVYKIFGIAKGQSLKYDNFISMVHPEDRDHVVKSWQAALEGEEYDIEHRILVNGKVRWVREKAFLDFDNNGKLVAGIGIVQDITDRKTMELDVIESQKKLNKSNLIIRQQLFELENLYKNTPVGLCVLDPNLKFLRINDRLAEINGVAAEDHIGKTVTQIIPDLYERSSAIVHKILETGQAQTGIIFSGTTPARPGVKRYWSEDWSPIRNGAGQIISISVAVIEITEQKLAQEQLNRKQKQLRKAKTALQKSKKKLTLALENGEIGLWEWDMVKDMVTWDKRMEDMFGLEPGTFDGKASTFESLIHEDDLAQVRHSIEKSISQGISMESVYRTKAKNGKSNYILSKALIVKDKYNKPVSVMGVCFDVTRIQEGAEQHIVKLNEELLRSNTDLRQFAYIASHDLQEPLRMISSFVQLLRNRYEEKLDQDAREYIQYAVEGSKRMYDLLNGLLAYSRLQTKENDFSRTDLTGVLEKVRSNLSLYINESGTEIICKGLPVVYADENQMGQLLQNLIENAIKFSCGKPRITISATESSSEHLVKVSDEGIGIDPQYYERIFRIFQRLHNRSEYRGTGIGLAICKRIIERHGGRIWVESVPGKGSTFFFTIPKISK